jgi:AAA+ superfamily predicted ATPase
VSSLLLQIDDLPDYVVIVAASNHPELLDRAVWRRFQLRIELPSPSRSQLTKQIQSLSKRFNIDFGLAPETLAKHLLGHNFSEVEEFCLSIARRAVLDRQADNAQNITKANLSQWKKRLKPIDNNM